jgi:hypothetical protein
MLRGRSLGAEGAFIATPSFKRYQKKNITYFY